MFYVVHVNQVNSILFAHSVPLTHMRMRLDQNTIFFAVYILDVLPNAKL